MLSFLLSVFVTYRINGRRLGEGPGFLRARSGPALELHSVTPSTLPRRARFAIELQREGNAVDVEITIQTEADAQARTLPSSTLLAHHSWGDAPFNHAAMRVPFKTARVALDRGHRAESRRSQRGRRPGRAIRVNCPGLTPHSGDLRPCD